jgi:hypothetical protein
METSKVNCLGGVIFDILTAKVDLTGSSISNRLHVKLKSETGEDVSLDEALADKIATFINALPEETLRVKPLIIAQLKTNDDCKALVDQYLA